MPAQPGAAFLHVSLSAFTFGFENALLMFSYVLVFRELGNGSVRFASAFDVVFRALSHQSGIRDRRDEVSLLGGDGRIRGRVVRGGSSTSSKEYQMNRSELAERACGLSVKCAGALRYERPGRLYE